MTLKGIAASGGIGIGKAVCLKKQGLDFSAVEYAGKEAEKSRLTEALHTFEEKTQAMADAMKAQVGEEEAEILTGQLAMVNDPFLQSQLEDAIEGGQCAEAAVDAVLNLYAEMFAGVEDELMRQRATDVKDIRQRLLEILLGAEPVHLAQLPPGTVLVADDLTPSMTAQMKKEHVAAILTQTGGYTSHSAILARALEIPAVLSIPTVLEKLSDGQALIVDGDAGEALLTPDERTMAEYTAKRAKKQAERELLETYRDRETVDADGKRYQLFANVGSTADAKAAVGSGAEGIGLFRTEFLFMDRKALPTEAEQYDVYSEVASLFPGKEVIIRTLDVGGDKDIPYLGFQKEENPFLGHRAIRYCLDAPGVFKMQLRALLRAGAKYKNIKIILPLVTSVDEVRAAKSLLRDCKTELKADGKAFDQDMALGVMIETPAAAAIADLLADEVDFFSIGTNDLTQYTLAVDRGNARVEKLYTSFHPAVLRSISRVIQAAKASGIPVGMCGEAAADPRLIPLFLHFGLDEFSVGTASILATRRHIAAWHSADAEYVTEEAMRLSGAAGIEGYLRAACKGK